MNKELNAQTTAEYPPVRLGVIGAGWFASRRHLPDVQNNPNVTLTTLCRRDEAARAKVAEHFHVPAEHAYGDWKQMLDAGGLDAVLIATPHSLHYEQARECLERGLHVLIEKPMTVHGKDAWDLVALAKRKGLQLSVAVNPPFWAHCHRIKRALKSATMGTLESASLYWSGSAEYVFGRLPTPENLPGIVAPTMYRADPELNGGGYLMDGGPHLISSLLWTTGLRARRVSALMDSTPTDMRALLSIELENGAMATINSVGNSKFGQRRVRNIYGATNGYVTVSGYEFETCISVHEVEHQKFCEEDLMSIGTPIGNFADAIQGKAALFSSPEHGADVVDVLEAAYVSATTGQAVTIARQAAVAP